MTTMASRDEVVQLAEVPPPAGSQPHPHLLADENTLVIAYMSKGGTVAIIAFQHCYASHFGLPNDNAFATHTVGGLGLRPCCAFEVRSSTWLSALEQRNLANPRHDPTQFTQLRHFVWTFEISVLECASSGYTVTESPGTVEEMLPRMHALLQSP